MGETVEVLVDDEVRATFEAKARYQANSAQNPTFVLNVMHWLSTLLR